MRQRPFVYSRLVVLTLALRRIGSYRLRNMTGRASHPVILATVARLPRVLAETRQMQSIQCFHTSFLHIQDRNLVSRPTLRVSGRIARRGRDVRSTRWFGSVVQFNSQVRCWSLA